MTDTTRRTFRQDFHTLRAIAITLIVGAHTLPSFDWSASPLTWRLIDTLCNESSVMFFFIAGFLFHHLSHRFEYSNYLTNKLTNVILPYLLISIPALILFIYFIPKHNAPWSDAPAWHQVLMYYVTGRHLAPLWFVPTICFFYLLAPAFLYVDRHQRWLYWALPVLICISAIIGRDALWGPIGKAVYLFPAYFGGIFASRYRDEIEAQVSRFLWPLVCSIAVIYGLMVVEILPKPTHIVLKLLMALVLLHFLRIFQHRITNDYSDYVADVSFGIFFIHAYLIGAFAYGLTVLSGNVYATGQAAGLPASLSLYLVFTALVLGASVGLIWISQKILGRSSRMLVGA